MSEDKDNLLKHYRDLRTALLFAIEGLSNEQLSDPSLDGWAVKDHLAHIALWDDIRASEVSRISAGHDSVWRMSGEQDDAFNAMSHELRLHLSPAQARWELETSRERLLDAIAAAPPSRLDASLYGEAALRSQHEAEHAGWIKRWRDEKQF